MNEINFNIEETEKIDLSMDVGIKEVYPPIEDLKVTPSKEQQIFNHENSYGYDNVTVEPINLQDKSITIKSNGTQEIVSDEGYDGLNQVKVITQIDGGGSGMNNYSTEEIVIGTWIDNKPLYRKVISVDVSSFTTEVNNIDYDFSTLDMAIDVRAILERQFNIIEVIPRTASSKNIDKWYGGIQLDKTGNKFIVELGTTLIERVNKGYRFYIIFEYTKTTD